MAYGWLDTITEINKDSALGVRSAGWRCAILKNLRAVASRPRIEIFKSLNFELESSGFPGLLGRIRISLRKSSCHPLPDCGANAIWANPEAVPSSDSFPARHP